MVHMQMLAISNHFASLVYLQNENVVLKSSIEDCTRTIQLVHSEMNGLKTLRNREKKLLEEQRKDKDVIKGMEGKLENANNLIRSLQGGGMLFNGNAHPHTTDKLKTTPSSQLEYHITPPRSATNHRRFAAELSTEKELRYKAEEICAGVLANSKIVLEERDSEISKLRSQLFRLSSKRLGESEKRSYEL